MHVCGRACEQVSEQAYCNLPFHVSLRIGLISFRCTIYEYIYRLDRLGVWVNRCYSIFVFVLVIALLYPL